MPPRAPLAQLKDDAFSSSEESDDGNPDSKRVMNFLPTSEDPRTLSQIKRSRIDLARRYVFLCPSSLSKHFDSLPHQAKDSALLVFRCSRSWLFVDPAAERAPRLQAKVDTGVRRNADMHSPVAGQSKIPLSSILYRSEYSREFLQWVLTKEKEGCVFWYKPERNLQKMSRFFEEKIDPVSELPYRPLILDPQWWRVRFQRTSARYIGNPSSVVAAISERSTDLATPHAQDFAIPTLQELIYQSNPTLEPLAKWPHAPSMRFLPREPPSRKDYVGQDSTYKGFIEHDFSRTSAGGALTAEYSRIPRWPEAGRDRFDNLHGLWQTEEASVMRRQNFAMHGMSTVGKNAGSLTAR